MDSTLLLSVYLLWLSTDKSSALSELQGKRIDKVNRGSAAKLESNSGRKKFWQSRRLETNCNSNRSLCNTVQQLSAIYATLRHVATRHPQSTKLTLIGKSYRNRPIYSLEIFRRSDTADFATVVVEFGMHGREWASTASALYTIHQLLDGGGDVITHVRWFIIPVLNPDGYYYSTRINNMWKKNRRAFKKQPCVGVDVNRNFDVAWHLNSESDSCKDYYAGPYPFSELESKAVKDFIESFEHYAVDVYVSVHSCGQAILYPYGYTDKELSPLKLERLQRAGRFMAKEIKKVRNRNYDVEVAYKIGGFRGGSTDYMFDNFHIPYAFTFELGSRIFFEENNFHHCYHPPSSAEMEYLSKECHAGLVALALHVNHSRVSETERRIPSFFNLLPPIINPSAKLIVSFVLLLSHL